MMDLVKQIKIAKKSLLNHGVVAFPTETVMGLGVVFDDPIAYEKLNRIKRRPEDKPYTMMVKSVDEIKKYAVINDVTQRVINAFMPGSITILVPVKENSVPNYVTHNTNIIGVRIPTNKEAQLLLNEVNKPLLVPSANRSGEIPALNSDEAQAIFGSEIDAIITGESLKERPSTIVDLTKDEVVIMREGPISLDEIQKVIKII